MLSTSCRGEGVVSITHIRWAKNKSAQVGEEGDEQWRPTWLKDAVETELFSL